MGQALQLRETSPLMNCVVGDPKRNWTVKTGGKVVPEKSQPELEASV
jgi:hypothetical protein